MEEKSIAYEMLEELKTNSRRWFKIAMVELLLILIIVLSFFIYESQYEYSDESYQYVDDTDMNNSTINQELGE